MAHTDLCCANGVKNLLSDKYSQNFAKTRGQGARCNYFFRLFCILPN